MRLLFFLLAFPFAAQAQSAREVDLELFLAVDVSRSMAPFELEIQRQGYAAALSSDAVLNAIQGGLIGEIAITYVEWAGVGSEKIVVPWTIINDRASAKAVADTISANFDPGLRRTSITNVLEYATRSIRDNDLHGLRRVIDVSGDGPNNQGGLVTRARDGAIAEGITINGLPLMTVDSFSERWGIPDLDVYYTECVIGGPGAFVVPVLEWEDFPEAITRKLILEIAGLTPDAQPRVIKANAYNCQIGEEIYTRNLDLFTLP